MLFYINNQVSPVVMSKKSIVRKLKALSLFLAFMCSFSIVAWERTDSFALSTDFVLRQ